MNWRLWLTRSVLGLALLATQSGCFVIDSAAAASSSEPPIHAGRPPATATPSLPGDRVDSLPAAESPPPPDDVEVIPTSATRPARPRPASPAEAVEAAPEPPATSDSRYDSVDRVIDELEFANIVFNAPNTMNLEESKVIHLTVAMEKTIDELKEMIVEDGEIEGYRIKVSDRMEARLTGTNFSITAITPENQAIGRTEATQWKWEVTPKSKGSHHLHLTLTAIIDVAGKQTQRAIRTFDHDIEIDVTWTQQATSLFKSYWQWLWAAILLPVFGWALKKWREKRAAGK